MTTYTARLMHAATGGEGQYQFVGAPDLLTRPADTVIAAFFDHIGPELQEGHVDYELNGAMNKRDKGVVIGMGNLVMQDDSELPFLVMISRA